MKSNLNFLPFSKSHSRHCLLLYSSHICTVHKHRTMDLIRANVIKNTLHIWNIPMLRSFSQICLHIIPLIFSTLNDYWAKISSLE